MSNIYIESVKDKLRWTFDLKFRVYCLVVKGLSDLLILAVSKLKNARNNSVEIYLRIDIPVSDTDNLNPANDVIWTLIDP